MTSNNIEIKRYHGDIMNSMEAKICTTICYERKICKRVNCEYAPHRQNFAIMPPHQICKFVTIRPSEFLQILPTEFFQIFLSNQNFCQLDLQNFCRFYIQNFCRFGQKSIEKDTKSWKVLSKLGATAKSSASFF